MSEAAGPINLIAEQALLGALLINDHAIDQVQRIVEPQHFSEPLHGRIYEVILELTTAGRVAKPPIVRDFLPDDLKVGKLSRDQYLARLARDATTVINAPDFARTVRDLWLRRGLAIVGEEMAAIARDPPKELMAAAAQIEDAETRLSELREMGRVERSQGMAFHIEASIAAMSKAYQDNVPIGMEWCLPEIERVVDARMEPGDLTGLLGASGDGKSSLMNQQARFTAEQGVPVFVLSGEQSVQQCLHQLSAQRILVPAKDIKNGRLNESEAMRFIEDQRAIKELPLEIETWSDSKVAQLSGRIRAFTRRFGSGLIIIDHAKKIVPDHRGDILAQQIIQIYYGLKNVAMATGCTILLLMQRNSDFLNRKIQRPVKGDAYGGEGTLQALDTCFAVYRPSKWIKERAKLEERENVRRDLLGTAAALDDKAGSNHQNDGVSMAHLYCLKSRFGDDGLPRQELRFEGRFTRFVQMPGVAAQQEMAEML